LRRLQHQDVGHTVHHHTHNTRLEVQDDHDGLVVVFDILKVELDAHVHNGHDDAAQIGHPLDERGNVGNTRDALAVIAANLLNFQDINAVFLCGKRKDKIFL